MTDSAYAAGAAYIDGAFVPVEEARIPLLDWGFLRSDACQDTVTAWKGRFFRLDDHLARFERSFTALRMKCPLSADQRKQVVFDAVRVTGFRDAYVQMIMTRGRPPIGSRDVRLCDNRFYLFCVPYMWIATPEVQERGLHLHVSSRQRVPAATVDPTIKHYHWLDFQQGLLDAYDRGAETVVVSDESGNVAEGPGFNIFLARDGRLVTPDAACLDGLTRDTVFRLSKETNLACEARAVPRGELEEADEVFLTTSAGGILPVTLIDGRPVTDGQPGPITLRLRDLYWSKRESGWLETPAVYDEGDQKPSSSG
jgi:branched-chain amino acid aminotransferase